VGAGLEGLDVIMDATVDEHGCAVIPEFATWVADLQRNEGKSQKAAREWREEQESLRKGADKDNKEKGKWIFDYFSFLVLPVRPVRLANSGLRGLALRQFGQFG
jgi:hypothetical protein